MSVLVLGLTLATGAGSASAQSVGVPTYGAGSVVNVVRQQGLDQWAVTDVDDFFKGSSMVSTANLIVGAGSEGNSVVYRSGAMHRVTARAAYTGDEAAAQGTGALAMAGNRAWGMSLGFEAGPLVLRLAHQNRAVAGAAPLTSMGNTLEAKNSIVAANVRLGVATAYAAYSVSRGHTSAPLWNPDNPYSVALASTPSNKSRDMLVGVALPLGGATMLASFIRKNDRDVANHDTNQLALGATCAVARRTDVYLAYSRISNRNSAYPSAHASSGGGAAVNIGMRHGF